MQNQKLLTKKVLQSFVDQKRIKKTQKQQIILKDKVNTYDRFMIAQLEYKNGSSRELNAAPKTNQTNFSNISNFLTKNQGFFQIHSWK